MSAGLFEAVKGAEVLPAQEFTQFSKIRPLTGTTINWTAVKLAVNEQLTIRVAGVLIQVKRHGRGATATILDCPRVGEHNNRPIFASTPATAFRLAIKLLQ
jgi:hypothetical protein